MIKATVDTLERSLFTTSKPDEKSHRCVMVFDSKRAITYQHGFHSSLKEQQKIVLYNVMQPKTEIEVVVSVVSKKHDFVVFELTDGEFPNHPSDFDSMHRGQDYRQLGVNQKRQPVWKEGIISKMSTGYFLGTSHGEHGDSGTGIFNLSGRFIGISVAKKRFALSDLQISGPTIDLGELADHHPETKIISASVIYAHLDIDDPDFPPPEKKRAPGTE